MPSVDSVSASPDGGLRALPTWGPSAAKTADEASPCSASLRSSAHPVGKALRDEAPRLAVGEDLARVEDSPRVEGALDLAHEAELGLAQLERHEVLLDQ